MASKAKKNKERNAYSDHGHAMKEKRCKLKRRYYFNASLRRANNKFPKEDI